MKKFVMKLVKIKLQFVRKLQVYEAGTVSDLNSACSKVLVSVKIFQFQDMGNESERYWDLANGLSPVSGGWFRKRQDQKCCKKMLQKF
jgi:hypothetical protein